MHPRIAASVRVAPVRMESLPRPSGVRVPAEADEMMEYDDPRKGIGIYQRFLIATGEAAQQGAQLELNLRLLRQRLTSDGHTGAVTAALESGEFVAPAVKGEKVVPPASTLIDDCLQMIPKELTVETERAAAEGALQAARRALLARNRIVHDLWLGGDGGVATLQRAAPG